MFNSGRYGRLLCEYFWREIVDWNSTKLQATQYWPIELFELLYKRNFQDVLLRDWVMSSGLDDFWWSYERSCLHWQSLNSRPTKSQYSSCDCWDIAGNVSKSNSKLPQEYWFLYEVSCRPFEWYCVLRVMARFDSYNKKFNSIWIF